jgi:segregation and condensation protein A
VDILHIPVAAILEQYLDYVAILEQIDVNAAGDFLSLASTLIEIKSIELLPGDETIEKEIDDPRRELVKQLLVYKELHDSAAELEQRSRRWQQRYPRLANDLPPRPKNLDEEPIREVELWDIVSAFERVIRDNSPKSVHEVKYDDTPIATHIKRIANRLKLERRISLRQLFEPNIHKSKMTGMFLAVLELVRHEQAYVYQDYLFGEIEIEHRQGSKPLEFLNVE